MNCTGEMPLMFWVFGYALFYGGIFALGMFTACVIRDKRESDVRKSADEYTRWANGRGF